MKVDKKHMVGRMGVSAVSHAFANLKWLFREQPISDFGIDAQVEIVKDDKPTGKLIALQIKSGSSFFAKVRDDKVFFRGDKKHLDYWLKHSLPVVLILHNPNNSIIIWQLINENTITKTPKGWTVEISLNQRLDKYSIHKLSKISDKPRYIVKLQNLQLARPWIEKLDTGYSLFIEVQEWINKTSGRGDIKLIVQDVSGKTKNEYNWSVMFPGWRYEDALPEFFPWADLSIDEVFYDDYDRDKWKLECGSYDKETDTTICYEDFSEWAERHLSKGIRPYDDNGEVAFWRLELNLNEFGKAFMFIDGYLSSKS